MPRATVLVNGCAMAAEGGGARVGRLGRLVRSFVEREGGDGDGTGEAM